MPMMTFSQAMTANQRGLNPVNTTGWAYEYLPWNAFVRVRGNATTAGVQVTIKTGSQEIIPRSPLQAGGTAGVIPAALNTPTFEFLGSAGDRLGVFLDEVLGGTPTVNLIIEVDPV